MQSKLSARIKEKFMSPEPSTQNPINPELPDLLARVETQLQASREVINMIRQQREEGEKAIQSLIDSNNELARALLFVAEGKNQGKNSNLIPALDSDEMKLSKSLVRPDYLDEKYFERGNGKVLLLLAKAHCHGSSGVTLLEMVAETGFKESTNKNIITRLRRGTIGPNTRNGTDVGKTYEIRNVGLDKWALVKLQSEPSS